MKKLCKPVSILLSFIMVFSLFTIIPFEVGAASGIEYIIRSWDEVNQKVVDTVKTCSYYETLTSRSSLTLGGGKWYVVNGDATIENRVTVSGTAHIILLSGTLRCMYGIRLSKGNSLYVYPGKNSEGKLNPRTGDDEEASLGGNEGEDCGEFVFYGGTLEAHNYEWNSGNATIGGGGYGGFDFSNMGDIFSEFGFGSFSDLFGGGSRSSSGPMRGANLRASVSISFEEAIRGCEKELEINLKDVCPTCGGNGAKPGTKPETCPKCRGTGRVVVRRQSMFGMMQTEQDCPDCNGTGKIIREKCTNCCGTGYITKRTRISVSIPAGIDNGMSVRIRDKGEPGTGGGPRGGASLHVVAVHLHEQPAHRRAVISL